MSTKIQGGSNTAGLANVNAAYKLEVGLETNASSNPTQVGSVKTFSENDDGTVTGIPYLKSPETSPDFRLRVGQDTILFHDTFNATTQNTGLYKHEFTTMTMTQSAGFLNVNAAGTSTVSGNFAYLRTWRTFPLIGSSALSIETTFQLTNQALQVNEVYHIGIGIPTTGTEPVDGIWFELTNAGLYGVMKYNSGVSTKQLLTSTPLTLNKNVKIVIVLGEREVEFWIDDVFYGEMEIPAGQSSPFLSVALPYFILKYNNGTVGSSPSSILKVGDVVISIMDIDTLKPWAHQAAGQGLSGQGLNGGTMGSLATWPNSTNPTTALPVNGSLTSNLPTGLGGQGLATLWNLAATDMALLAWLNPQGGVNQTPRVCYITGVKISAASFTAAWTAPAAGQHLFQWGIGYGSVAANLGATETASFATNTTKAVRRKPLGLMGWSSGTAPIGTPCDKDIYVKFDTPIVVNPAEYLLIMCKMLNGAATATGGMYFTVDFDHYFE
jgi:hypothetical protein